MRYGHRDKTGHIVQDRAFAQHIILLGRLMDALRRMHYIGRRPRADVEAVYRRWHRVMMRRTNSWDGRSWEERDSNGQTP